MSTPRLCLLALVLVVGAAFLAAGPDEQALDRSCIAFAPTAKACERL